MKTNQTEEICSPLTGGRPGPHHSYICKTFATPSIILEDADLLEVHRCNWSLGDLTDVWNQRQTLNTIIGLVGPKNSSDWVHSAVLICVLCLATSLKLYLRQRTEPEAAVSDGGWGWSQREWWRLPWVALPLEAIWQALLITGLCQFFLEQLFFVQTEFSEAVSGHLLL